MKRRLKRIVFDVAGVGLIVMSGLLGWLPGPGGIPLFLAGLGLLAVHNDWAKKILIWAQKNAENFLEIIFPLDNKKVMFWHDVYGIVAIITGGVLFVVLSQPYNFILPMMLLASGAFWLLYNRRRYKHFIPNKH